jgi:hypothetical protein
VITGRKENSESFNRNKYILLSPAHIQNSNVYEDIIKIAKERKEDDVAAKLNILNERTKKHNEITAPSDPYAVILHEDC